METVLHRLADLGAVAPVPELRAVLAQGVDPLERDGQGRTAAQRLADAEAAWTPAQGSDAGPCEAQRVLDAAELAAWLDRQGVITDARTRSRL